MIFITMKNIFTTKVKWFKDKISPPKQDEWTHLYYNSLGNPVRCSIQRVAFNGKDVWVLNENDCGVKLLKTDLQKIIVDNDNKTE